MKVAITGIGGYIASNIAACLPRDYEIVGVGRPTKFERLRRLFADRVRMLESDILDSTRMREACRGADAIVNSTGPIVERYCRENPEDAQRTIVEGTRLVTDIAEEEGAFLIHLSTLSVYSTHLFRRQPVTEESELLPDTVYGKLKADAEREAARIPSLILRISNVFGCGDAIAPHEHVVTTIFVSRALKGEPLVVNGEGEEAFDFVHLRDVARFVAEVLARPPELPLVLNVSYGSAIKVRALAEVVRAAARELFGKEVTIEYVPSEGREARPSRWLANQRLRVLAPWFPAVSIEEGVREMLQKYPQARM